MKIKEMIELLKTLEQDTEVVVADTTYGESDFEKDSITKHGTRYVIY